MNSRNTDTKLDFTSSEGCGMTNASARSFIVLTAKEIWWSVTR